MKNKASEFEKWAVGSMTNKWPRSGGGGGGSDTFDTYIESRLVLMTIWVFLKSVWRNRL